MVEVGLSRRSRRPVSFVPKLEDVFMFSPFHPNSIFCVLWAIDGDRDGAAQTV